MLLEVVHEVEPVQLLLEGPLPPLCEGQGAVAPPPICPLRGGALRFGSRLRCAGCVRDRRLRTQEGEEVLVVGGEGCERLALTVSALRLPPPRQLFGLRPDNQAAWSTTPIAAGVVAVVCTSGPAAGGGIARSSTPAG